jgi:hypothetical protein
VCARNLPINDWVTQALHDIGLIRIHLLGYFKIKLEFKKMSAGMFWHKFTSLTWRVRITKSGTILFSRKWCEILKSVLKKKGVGLFDHFLVIPVAATLGVRNESSNFFLRIAKNRNFRSLNLGVAFMMQLIEFKCG